MPVFKICVAYLVSELKNIRWRNRQLIYPHTQKSLGKLRIRAKLSAYSYPFAIFMSVIGGFALDSILKGERMRQQEHYEDGEFYDPSLHDVWEFNRMTDSRIDYTYPERFGR